jgi:hypothetical protein
MLVDRECVLPRRGEYVSESTGTTEPISLAGIGSQGGAAGKAADRAADRAADKIERCPWCDIFVRSAAGMCTCNEACGCLTCPARNADDYTPPPVPKFARPVAAA